MINANYRPISRLPIIGKLQEKLMQRLSKFLYSQNILTEQQFVFQKDKSTEQAILDIQSTIIDAFENKHPMYLLRFCKSI